MKKAAKKLSETGFRYEPEDLKPRDHSAEDAALGDFITRNKAALIESLDEADREDERGEGRTLDDVLARLARRNPP